MSSRTYQALVAGAGLAGLAAARALAGHGLDVVVLEARDIVGGRTRTEAMPGAGRQVDLGAEWVCPDYHPAVMAELARYGIAVDPEPEGAVPFWDLVGRSVCAQEVLTDGESEELGMVLAAMEADAARIDFSAPDWHAAVTDLDIPFDVYLDGQTASRIVQERILIWSFTLMGAHERQYSALSLLHELAGFGSALGAFEGYSVRITDGTATIARAMAAELGTRIRLSMPVRAIALVPDGGVQVDSGEDLLTADVAVIAIPVNVLAHLDIDVPLPPGARAALAQRHAGSVAKIWTLADTLPDLYTSFGWPHIPEAYGVRGDTGQAVAAFQLSAPDSADATERSVIGGLSARHPGVSFRNPFWHDWVSDPWSRGTWFTPRAGQVTGWYDLAAVPGPCFFAGGDLSRRWVGWMDGALTSGTDAAERALEHLQSGSSRPVRG